jgi:N-acetylmuramoyl-L-alanine amidase
VLADAPPQPVFSAPPAVHAAAPVFRPSPPAGRAAAARSAPRPRIVWDPIPFPKKRVDETRAYAVRHYGLHRARLIAPKVVVEHLTVTTTWQAAFNTFASDAPDPELHERPGTCAHFVVDGRGTIHQLVSLKWMCRHTVGLNWTAIGIEHVGTSESGVMGNARQLRASLRLTRWLQARYGIATREVIGHNESLSSPYHRERVTRLRTQTHGDFPRRVMRRYRELLAAG